MISNLFYISKLFTHHLRKHEHGASNVTLSNRMVFFSEYFQPIKLFYALLTPATPNPRLDWPVRTLSFSHDGKMLASASEDHFIDIAEVETGECVSSTSLEHSDVYITFFLKQTNGRLIPNFQIKPFGHTVG